jgi:hypothetical protein
MLRGRLGVSDCCLVGSAPHGVLEDASGSSTSWQGSFGTSSLWQPTSRTKLARGRRALLGGWTLTFRCVNLDLADLIVRESYLGFSLQPHALRDGMYAAVAILNGALDVYLPRAIYSRDVSSCHNSAGSHDRLLVGDIQPDRKGRVSRSQFLSNNVPHGAVKYIRYDPAMQEIGMRIQTSTESVEPSDFAFETFACVWLSVERQQMWNGTLRVESVTHERMPVSRLCDSSRHADDPEGRVVQCLSTP